MNEESLQNKLVVLSVSELHPYHKNPKKHTQYGINLIKKSIVRNGFGEAMLVDGDTMEVLSGNGRLQAVKELGIEQVPCYVVYGLTDKQKADLVIGANKIGENGKYDKNVFASLVDDFGLDVEDFGMSPNTEVFSVDDGEDDDTDEESTESVLSLTLEFSDESNLESFSKMLREIKEANGSTTIGDGLIRYLIEKGAINE